MKIYISTFNNIRYFTPNMIPISTAGDLGWPYWLYKSDNKVRGTYYLNSNSVMIGIKEESLSFPKNLFQNLTEQCQGNCPYAAKAPNCEFMQAYYRYLCSLDFNKLLEEFHRVAEDVRKINNFEGEPIVVLLVYEAPSRICGERYGLQKWFADNNYELKELTKEVIESKFNDNIF